MTFDESSSDFAKRYDIKEEKARKILNDQETIYTPIEKKQLALENRKTCDCKAYEAGSLGVKIAQKKKRLFQRVVESDNAETDVICFKCFHGRTFHMGGIEECSFKFEPPKLCGCKEDFRSQTVFTPDVICTSCGHLSQKHFHTPTTPNLGCKEHTELEVILKVVPGE